jgi:hypothetical protein
MSLELYSLIPGQQVKRDRDLSNVTIQCDPRAVYPDNESSVNNRFRKREAGKIAVEDDICNLNVANLTVNGQLKLNGEIAAEICNIFCPEDFNLVAGSSINIQGLGTAAADVITINTENQNTNAIHLHIPTGTGGAANVGEQINIQNQYNTNAASIQIKSDLGGVFVESAGLIQITPGARLKFFAAAGAGGAPTNPGAAAAGNANDAVIDAIVAALRNYGLFT